MRGFPSKMASNRWGSPSFWTMEPDSDFFHAYPDNEGTDVLLADALSLSSDFKCLLAQKVSFLIYLAYIYYISYFINQGDLNVQLQIV